MGNVSPPNGSQPPVTDHTAPVRASLIIPAHNCAAALRRCLASVLDQDVVDFEVIVVDDGSSDQTASVAEAAVGSDRRARVLRLPRNVGAAAARNHAIRQARGDVLLLLDSDCVVGRDWVRLHCEAQQSAGIVGGAISGMHTSMFGRADGYCSWFDSIPSQARERRAHHHLPTANLSVARRMFERIGLFREGERLYSEDAEFCARARAAGEALFFDPAIVVQHQDRDTLHEYLHHQWVAGVQMLNYRREPGAEYRWLMPRNWLSGALLALPIAAAYTALIVRRWIATDARVLAYVPLIFIGKVTQSAALVAYSRVPSSVEAAAPRLPPRS